MSKQTVIEQAVEQFLDHAYQNHVIGRRNGYNEFAEFGVENADQLRNLVHKTLNDPGTMGAITSKNGSHVLFYNERDNIFIALEPKSGGSMFRPIKGIDHFLDEVDVHRSKMADNFLEVKSGGLPALQEAFSDKFGHAMKLGPLARLGQAFDIAVEIAPRALGRIFKFVPLAGTAATYMQGRAEAAELRDHAQAAVADGKLPSGALVDYEMVLNMHQLQVNADISIIGREPEVQEGFANFVKAYEPYFKAHPEMLEDLEPPSLAEDLFGQELDRNMPQWAANAYIDPASP